MRYLRVPTVLKFLSFTATRIMNIMSMNLLMKYTHIRVMSLKTVVSGCTYRICFSTKLYA